MEAHFCAQYCSNTMYRIVGIFDSDNVWQKWMDKAFDKKTLANEYIYQRLLIVTTNLDDCSLACR